MSFAGPDTEVLWRGRGNGVGVGGFRLWVFQVQVFQVDVLESPLRVGLMVWEGAAVR